MLSSSISKIFLNKIPNKPGIYKMLDGQGNVLYVGKAKNLKKRLRSYFRERGVEFKTQIFLAKVADIEITITSNETEALLLENNLIKTLKPRYNILFKDDKSYPYLVLSEHQFPSLTIYRGAAKKGANYFGPFPSALAVRDTLNLLQKIFKLRSCIDSFFSHRVRPCVQYQIKRCSAPCVGYIDKMHYQKDVNLGKLFLSGKSNVVIEQIIKFMEQASKAQEYETAAYYRDQIINLKKIQQQQYMIKTKGKNNADVIVLVSDLANNLAVLSMVFVRNGTVLGSKNYLPKLPVATKEEEILTKFLAHYYLVGTTRGSALPDQILLDRSLSDTSNWENAIAKFLNHKIRILHSKSAAVKKWLEIAKINAEDGFARLMAAKIDFSKQFVELQTTFNLSQVPNRIECFDVSHYRGEATIASCVVFEPKGPLKNSYRKFNIKNVTLGDDYAALQEALLRHYKNLQQKPEILPQVLIIDGGKGQLHIAQEVLNNLGFKEIFLVAIAKGAERKPGKEEIYVVGRTRPILLDPTSKVFHLLQRIRDEAHRFAIQSQRRRLLKKRTSSILENIPGIGKAKSSELLRQFGGLAGIKNASVTELVKVSGVNSELAKRIYEYLHA